MDEALHQNLATAPIGGERALLAGVTDVLPILPGVLPFGMIYGAAAVASGLRPLEAQGMSLAIFAGASQVAAIELLAHDAAWWTVLIAMLVINSRFVMYGASLAQTMPRLRGVKGVVASYLLTDQAYAVTLLRSREHPSSHGLVRYYFGASLSLWCTWQVGSAIGILLGALVPASWQLEFSIPLMFLALLVPVLEDRPAWVAAITAGGVMLLTRGLPHNLGLIVGVVMGIAAGMFTEPRLSSKGNVDE
jgi:branched chain amino acid efflux pump